MIPKSPLFRFTALLGLYALVTLILNFSTSHLYHAGAVAVLFFLIHLVTSKLLKKSGDWKNSTISALILFLLVNPPFDTTEYGFLAMVAAFFLIGKVLRYKSLPLVNPIVFATIVTHLILLVFDQSLFVTWWGAGYMGSLSTIWLAPVVLYGAYKFRKLHTVIPYVVLYALLSSFLGGQSLLYLFTAGTIYFAGGIMLLEPKTSPAKKGEQVLFGIIAAGATYGFSLWTSALPLLFGIASGNLLYACKRIIAK